MPCWYVPRRPECTMLAYINMSMYPDYLKPTNEKTTRKIRLFLLTVIKANQDRVKEYDVHKTFFSSKIIQTN